MNKFYITPSEAKKISDKNTTMTLGLTKVYVMNFFAKGFAEE